MLEATKPTMTEKNEEEKEVKQAVKKFYPDLLQVLPLSHLVPCLYSEGLISSTNVNKLKHLSEVERIKYFLDDVLIPGVEIGYTELFKKLLGAMEVSDDGAVKFLARKIYSFMSTDSVASLTSSATPPFAPPTVTGTYILQQKL